MILHMDMDAFFASVEQADNPDLKGKPVIIGRLEGRGVVSTASYEARAFGVHSAMPVFKAREKCPDGIFIAPRMGRYQEISSKMMAVLQNYSPVVEMASIDEAYMDITGMERMFDSPESLARSIKLEIQEKFHLTCSIGIATTRFLAKIASDMQKPDGLFMISPDQARDFIETLPIGKVPGVGQVTLQGLAGLGIETLGDIRKFPEAILTRKLGKFGKRILELSENIDSTPVTPESAAKSVSCEETLVTDTLCLDVLKPLVLKFSDAVAADLRRLNVKAKTIHLKIRFHDFEALTRSKTLETPTQTGTVVFQQAMHLLESIRISKRVRLIGVGASSFVLQDTPVQMDLFDAAPRKTDSWAKVDKALDAISEKFGKSLVKKGALHKKK